MHWEAYKLYIFIKVEYQYINVLIWSIATLNSSILGVRLKRHGKCFIQAMLIEKYAMLLILVGKYIKQLTKKGE